MMSTIVVRCLFLGLLTFSIGAWALFLFLGLRWTKCQPITIRQIVLTTLGVLIPQLSLGGASYLLLPTDLTFLVILGIANFASTILIPCFVIARIFKISLFRAMQAWLPTLLTPVLLLSIILSVFPKFFIETFVIPMNGMAPTVLGNHWQGACVECGNPAFCSPTRRPVTSSDRPVMICRDNFHVTQPTNYDKQVIPPDRFLIAKFLRPQRWDIVVFRYPADPSLLYVKRLIGLPGEEIIIRDGQVWANGQMLAKPNSIHGIDYVSEIPKWHGELSGTPNRPAKLADNEYFVLGDFSPQSKDSRLWTQGAPGQNPFAVPQSHLYGVVTQIYWPPSRWRRFR